MKIAGTITALIGGETKIFESAMTLPDPVNPGHANNAIHQLHQQLHNLANQEQGSILAVTITTDAPAALAKA